ncbi:inositol 2-dehydrogenase [Phyllobacterium sp. YR531]|uniref:inositol 2-dehydrogenase n=1 Tax=Phyllobacterium sp. YR531 TaxID=1144343 RepID=UPI00026FA0EC|nr:inositol 2-dehydrogenase [Phyllobacterium sp. YR531]EJN06009.1 putative dehydrogenase [Phyllobacterium sp. YR531]
MTIKLALIGAGRIGKVHARAVRENPEAEISAVTDALPAAAEAFSRDWSCAHRSLDDIETDRSIDAVLICSPTDTHADLIERFARAGKAIFCEKPIDLDVERARKVLEIVKQTNAKLMIGFNRRFDPHFRAVRDAIDSGRIGTVEMVTITSRDPGAPPVEYAKRSGGLFRDMTIHDFDMARFLLGEEPVSVSAHASVLVDPELGKIGDHDSATVILETASGKQAVISNSRRATYGYDQRVEVHGSKGVVSAENQRAVSIEIGDEAGYSKGPLLNFFMDRYTRSYANEIASFIDALTTGKAITPSGADGLAALVLADAATRSVTEKQRITIA